MNKTLDFSLNDGCQELNPGDRDYGRRSNVADTVFFNMGLNFSANGRTSQNRWHDVFSLFSAAFCDINPQEN
jgi:hypothetical protein